MADLSAYIDFSIVIDRSDVDNPVIRVTDPDDYPAGVNIYLEGVLSITQPDGLSITGNFITPDISWDGSGLSVAEKELRLSDDDTIQTGIYTITYTISVTGYDDTVLTKTIDLDYVAVTQSITNLTDVFTPVFYTLDGTTYTLEGFNTPTITRAWEAIIRYIGTSIATITGSSQLFTMSYNGLYYDANYAITLETTLTYVNTDEDWVTVKDMLSSTSSIDPYTPPTLAELAASLRAMRLSIEDGTYCGGSNCGCDIDYTPFNDAQNLYDLIKANGQAGQTVGLNSQMEQLQKLLNCSGILDQDHTYTYIPAYSFSDTSVSTAPTPIEFLVSDTSFIPNGNSSVTITAFIGYNLFFIRAHTPQSTVNEGGDYYSWDKDTGAFTCYDAAFTGQLFQLYAY